MAISYEEIKDNRKKLRAMTGHDKKEIEALLPLFTQALNRQEVKRKVSNRQRKRKLPPPLSCLFFILVNHKLNPLQTVMGVLFGMSQSQVNEWIHRLTPVLAEALERDGYLPEREPTQVAQAIQESQDNEFVLDGTERRRGRPVDNQEQRAYYSGKKKAHTIKNNVLTERNGQRVIYLSQTYPGRPTIKRLKTSNILIILRLCSVSKTQVFKALNRRGQPKKKPPKQERPWVDKSINSAISSLRVTGEQAISGIKRMRIVKDPLRCT